MRCSVVRSRISPRMRAGWALSACLAATLPIAVAHPPPLLPERDVGQIVNELSGETAKRNLEGLARLHRQRGSQGFHAAVELLAERARAYGLSDVEVLRFATDGKIQYGTQRGRRGWDAEQGELSEVRDARQLKIASFDAEPVVLAEDSESAHVTADLIDVGAGASDVCSGCLRACARACARARAGSSPAAGSRRPARWRNSPSRATVPSASSATSRTSPPRGPARTIA